MHSPAPSTGNRRQSEVVMIEVYAFLSMFAVQILAMSVVFPALLVRYLGKQATNFPDRLVQLFPGVDLGQGVERFVTRLRATNTVITVLGLVLLGWLFNYMQRQDWSHDFVMGLVVVSFMAQALPFLIEVVLGFRSYLKLLGQPSPESKRKAVLQRRGLFDFVSPFVVFLAVLVYFLFVAFMIYLQQRGFPANAVLSYIGAVTLVYLLDAFTLYVTLYKSRVFNPLETQESRGRWIGLQVKGTVYSCIFIVAFMSLICTLELLKLQRWEPFALSAFFVGCSISFFISLAAAPRYPDANGLGESPVQS
jgi:hypothetical protein